MQNDLILERLANAQHQALLREAEINRQEAPAVAGTGTSGLKRLLLALSCAVPLALLVARSVASG
jgi:hypothetical protein